MTAHMVAEIGYLALLVALLLLFLVNLHLRGRWTPYVSGAIASVVLGLLGLGFFLFNWIFGMLCIVITFAIGNLMVPLASRCAYRILGSRTGIGGVGEGDLLSRVVNGKLSVNDYFKAARRKKVELDAKLARLAQRPVIAAVLLGHDLCFDNYLGLYGTLLLCGLSDLALDILGDPDDLELLIEMTGEAKSAFEISSAFRRFRDPAPSDEAKC
jgi:hypothetical protein